MKKKKGKRKIPCTVLERYSLKAIWWLVKMARLDFDATVKVLNMLNNRQYQRIDKIPYRKFTVSKASGGRRHIYEPFEPLKEVQQGINRFILSELPQHPNVFGFSGSPNGAGTIEGALTPHLKSKTIMMVDIRDAFSSTDRKKVRSTLNKLPLIQIPGIGGIPDRDIAKIITDIATFSISIEITNSSNWLMANHAGAVALPQGAPTSPRLFDLVFRPIDEKLSHLAQNVGGVYTRYADNLFFSMPNEEFPEKIQRAITRLIVRKKYTPHKVKARDINSETIRALGLNIINGELHNTRKFKRNLRLTLHHLAWLKNNSQKTKHTRQVDTRRVLNGQISWARMETLPLKLRQLTEKSLGGKQLTLSA